MKLPVCMADVEITEKDLDAVVKQAIAMKDIDHNPYEITVEMLTTAIRELEHYHMEH